MPTRKCGFCRQDGHNRTRCPQIVYDPIHYNSLAIFRPRSLALINLRERIPLQLYNREEYANGEWLRNALTYNSVIPYTPEQIEYFQSKWAPRENIQSVGGLYVNKNVPILAKIPQVQAGSTPDTPGIFTNYLRGRNAAYTTQLFLLKMFMKDDPELHVSNLFPEDRSNAAIIFSNMCALSFNFGHVVNGSRGCYHFIDILSRSSWLKRPDAGVRVQIARILNIEYPTNATDHQKIIILLKAMLNYLWEKIPADHPIHKISLIEYIEIATLYRYVWNITATNNATNASVRIMTPGGSRFNRNDCVSVYPFIKHWISNTLMRYMSSNNDDYIHSRLKRVDTTVREFETHLRLILSSISVANPNITFTYLSREERNLIRQREMERVQRLREQRENARRIERRERHMELIRIQEAKNRSLAALKEYNPKKIIETDVCCICFDELQENNKAILPCGHQNCLQCVLKLYSQKRSNNTLCPFCRDDFTVVGTKKPNDAGNSPASLSDVTVNASV
jgi:hypothetical protein